MNRNKTIAFAALLLGALLIGAVIGRVSAARPPAVSRSSPEHAVSLPGTPGLPPGSLSGVPDVRQSTGYSCGAAALQAVLVRWGISEREDRMIARLRSTPQNGTHPDDIVRVAREFGLRAELREGLGLEDLEAALARGASVIVDLQAWREKEDRPWTETWDDGHYLVLLGTDDRNLYFEDPSLLGSRGYIPRQEFLDRWHDYEGDPPLDARDRTYLRMAIFIQGETPVPPPPLERVR